VKPLSLPPLFADDETIYHRPSRFKAAGFGLGIGNRVGGWKKTF
jgi:hypothetical protein